MTTHKAWVSSAIMALVTVLLILFNGESPDGVTLEQALQALAGALITGAVSWYATWRVPNKVKQEPSQPGDWPQSQARLQAAPLAVVAALGLTLFMLAACATAPDVRWAQAQQGYNDVLSALVSYREPCFQSEAWPDGGPDNPLCRISDDTYRQIEAIRAQVDSALRSWQAALDSGSTVGTDFYLQQVQSGLQALQRYLIQAQKEA